VLASVTIFECVRSSNVYQLFDTGKQIMHNEKHALQCPYY